MKKIVIYSLLFSSVVLSSSFKPGTSHRNIITFDDGLNWVWRADNCSAPDVPALTVRSMSSTKGFKMVDVTFQLPAGHCDIPSKGTIFKRYDGLDQTAVIHEDGSVRGKILIHPN